MYNDIILDLVLVLVRDWSQSFWRDESLVSQADDGLIERRIKMYLEEIVTEP